MNYFKLSLISFYFVVCYGRDSKVIKLKTYFNSNGVPKDLEVTSDKNVPKTPIVSEEQNTGLKNMEEIKQDIEISNESDKVKGDEVQKNLETLDKTFRYNVDEPVDTKDIAIDKSDNTKNEETSKENKEIANIVREKISMEINKNNTGSIVNNIIDFISDVMKRVKDKEVTNVEKDKPVNQNLKPSNGGYVPISDVMDIPLFTDLRKQLVLKDGLPLMNLLGN